MEYLNLSPPDHDSPVCVVNSKPRGGFPTLVGIIREGNREKIQDMIRINRISIDNFFEALGTAQAQSSLLDSLIKWFLNERRITATACLITAIRLDNADIVEALLRLGASKHIGLSWAIEFDRPGLVRLFSQLGVDLNRGLQLIIRGKQNEVNLSMLKTLLCLGGDINHAHQLAIERKFETISRQIQLWREYGWDTDYTEEAPTHLYVGILEAISNGDWPKLRNIIEAESFISDLPIKFTFVSISAMRITHEPALEEFIRWLIGGKMSVDVAFWSVLCLENLDLARILLRLGANPDLALVSVIKRGCFEMLKDCLYFGANPYGLILAAVEQDDVSLLLEALANGVSQELILEVMTKADRWTLIDRLRDVEEAL